MSCITEILKLKGDKEVFVPDGEWIAVEGGGTYKEHEYLIVLNTHGHRCGYVAIPPGHKYEVKPEDRYCSLTGEIKYMHYDYDGLDIECHGGLTFMSPDHSLKDLLPIPCTDTWIGFDCGHYLDSVDVEAMRKYYSEEHVKNKHSFISAVTGHRCQTVKDFHFVERECHSIIDQLIEKAA